MKRPVRACVLLAFLAVLPACLPFSIFEDVGVDPHPPHVQLLGIGNQPVEGEVDTTDETAVATTPDPVFSSPDVGFVVKPLAANEHTLILRVQFSDLGGDLTTFAIRDLDSSFSTTVSPPAVEVDIDGDGELETLTASDFFTGTTATINLEDIDFTSQMQGTHRLELWAEDSHESRSEKVRFTLIVVL